MQYPFAGRRTFGRVSASPEMKRSSSSLGPRPGGQPLHGVWDRQQDGLRLHFLGSGTSFKRTKPGTGQPKSSQSSGFELGMLVASDERGDAWIRAPDEFIATPSGRRATASYFVVTIESNETRWGAFTVQLPLPLTNDDEAASYLAALLPDLPS